MNSNLYLISILCVLLLGLLLYIKKQKNLKSGDKLFKSLVESSDTVYIMLDSNKNIMYLSDNVEKILGIKNGNKSDEQVVSEILNISIIKNELRNWDEKKQYVSQMVEYNNPMYNHNMWIRLKIFPYQEKNKKNNKTKSGYKLFNSLVESSDTVYIMLDSDKNIIYLSENVEKILGIKNSNKSEEQIVSEILNISIIKNELRNWDERKKYVSQMVEYNNPMYNHNMWIRLKIFPFQEKNKTYHIIEIVDSTKEHERQHLLISQASNIKTRESQLDQITSSSYDMEFDINLVTNTCNFKYFKLDNKYFGEEKRGKYSEIIKEIIDKYVNEKDKELGFSKLSINNLKDHFNKYELDSFSLRYRVGNEIKNNIWLESTVFFLSSKYNNKVSILTKNVTEDANSIREQNVLLQNALNDARIADKAKTDLITTISHDVRTPLTNIIGLSESLLEKQLNNNIKEDV